MPAKNSLRVNQKGTYSHIYNRGIEKRIIFSDRQDYEVFLGFLKDYLTTPPGSEIAKREFTVKGRIFRGVPHQPKNYFNKVELIAYTLMPNHFHLLLHQRTPGSLQSFLRSLCTRYSMYFNKKYNRSGALFEGPYKSVQVNGVSPLLHLTRYLHRDPIDNDLDSSEDYSSYPEYLGARSTLWVKPSVILTFFENSKNNSFKGVGGYKNFVEKYELTQKDKGILEGIALESLTERLERRIPKLVESKPAEEVHTNTKSDSLPSVSHIVIAVGVFLVLLTMGVRSIDSTIAKNTTPPEVAGVSSTPTPQEAKVSKMVIVSIEDKSANLNIRENPSLDAKKVGQASDGDAFEFVSQNSDWYEIKLVGGAQGFISKTYAKEEVNN